MVNAAGGAYIRSGVHTSAGTTDTSYHYICNPGGTVAPLRNPPNAGSAECGYAIFRIHCTEPVTAAAGALDRQTCTSDDNNLGGVRGSNNCRPASSVRTAGTRVNFRFEMAWGPNGHGTNDDSVYASLDGNRTSDPQGDSYRACEFGAADHGLPPV